MCDDTPNAGEDCEEAAKFFKTEYSVQAKNIIHLSNSNHAKIEMFYDQVREKLKSDNINSLYIHVFTG